MLILTSVAWPSGLTLKPQEFKRKRMVCLASDLTRSVDVWWASLDDLTERERAECIGLLSPSEMARYEAFKVDSARTQFLAARALLRTTLSRYRAISPKQWIFGTSSSGRPFIVESGIDEPGPFFNVSHTDGLIVCAVAAFPDLGVDVEHRRREINLAEMTPGVLSGTEIAWIDTLAESRRTEAFFTLWTLKEAYAKARGLGLSLSLASISFEDAWGSPRASFGADIGDDPIRWTFQTILDAPEHIISLAISPGGIEPRLTVRRTRALNTAG